MLNMISVEAVKASGFKIFYTLNFLSRTHPSQLFKNFRIAKMESHDIYLGQKFDFKRIAAFPTRCQRNCKYSLFNAQKELR